MTWSSTHGFFYSSGNFIKQKKDGTEKVIFEKNGNNAVKGLFINGNTLSIVYAETLTHDTIVRYIDLEKMEQV